MTVRAREPSAVVPHNGHYAAVGSRDARAQLALRVLSEARIRCESLKIIDGVDFFSLILKSL